MSDEISAALSNLNSIKCGEDPRNTTVASDGGSSTSILDMVTTYAQMEHNSLDNVYDSAISINSSGERMEYLIKDLLADSIDKESADEKAAEHKKYLSWLGSQNHPPDLMIRDGPAIEVKKSGGKHRKLQLNSSTPRTKLRSDMKRVNSDCTTCEDDIGGWKEKDMVYALGSGVTKSEFGFIWVVYGDCWCDDAEVYESVTEDLQDAIEQSPPSNGTLDTSGNEIAKVRNVGSGMGAEQRTRSMWSIGHPARMFSTYIDNYETKVDTGNPMFVVLPSEKFEDQPEQKLEEIRSNDDIDITTVDEQDCVIIEA